MTKKRFKRFQHGELVWVHPHARIVGAKFGRWYTGIVIGHEENNGILLGWIKVLASFGDQMIEVSLPQRAVLDRKPTKRDLMEQDCVTY